MHTHRCVCVCVPFENHFCFSLSLEHMTVMCPSIQKQNMEESTFSVSYVFFFCLRVDMNHSCYHLSRAECLQNFGIVLCFPLDRDGIKCILKYLRKRTKRIGIYFGKAIAFLELFGCFTLIYVKEDVSKTTCNLYPTPRKAVYVLPHVKR